MGIWVCACAGMTVSVAAPEAAPVMAAAPARLVVLRKSRRSWSMKASLDWFAACHAWHACAYCRLFPALVDHGRAPRAGEGAIVAANPTGAHPGAASGGANGH